MPARRCQPVYLLEFNEVNFEFASHYMDRGLLPHLKALRERGGIARTTSEQQYEHLEPWIQWVTAHTGLAFADHGVYRLGDIVKHDIPQIWERLEDAGLLVGAISPMNARYRLRAPAFFVPDPWTATEIVGPPGLKALYAAIRQAVNDNAQSKLTARSAIQLLRGFVSCVPPRLWAQYLRLMIACLSQPWRKAILLDRLLSDAFACEVERTKPAFASLFLNAAAHIQHHYLFSADCYQGKMRNPVWYIPAGIDPVLEVYCVYDEILGSVQSRFPDARVMVATGLRQDPHDEVTYYWRLRNHGAFLQKIGVPFKSIQPRMSRDFLVVCTSNAAAREAEARLNAATAFDGSRLFEVENRGGDLFVMLVYSSDIGADFTFAIGNQRFDGLRDDVVFVALKNGKHNGTGYFLDSGAVEGSLPTQFALLELPNRILAACTYSMENMTKVT